MTFELPLTEERVKPHQSTSMHLMSGFIFIGTGAVLYRIYQPLKYWGMALLIAGLVLLLTTIFRHKWVVKPGVNRVIRIAELMIFLCLASFCALKMWWVPTSTFGVLSASILFTFLWEKGDNSLYIKVDEEGIRLPVTSRKRFINWTEVEKILLRYGTITIDCIDNKFFQWNVKKTDVDPELFITFCNNQVEENRSKRSNDEW